MKKINSGQAIIFSLTIVPILIWLTIKPIAVRFASIELGIYSFGQIAGIIGLVLFSLSLVLSNRSTWLDKIFKGMNHVFSTHHFIGALAFVLLLFHPLLLASRYLQLSYQSTLLFILPEGDLAKDLGVYSLVLLALLLILTFFASLKYETWKKTHKFLGLTFFLGAIHAFLIPSDISQNVFLKYYLLSIISLGGTSYIYYTLLGRWTVKKYHYKVDEIKMLKENVTELSLVANGKKMDYQSGQFVFIKFTSGSLSKEIHPFSISSSSDEDKLRLTIKALGNYSRAISKATTGDQVEIEGPFGKFNYSNFKNKKQIWISGGIGVTPFLGMIDDYLKNKRLDYNIDFYYCIKNNHENIIKPEVSEKLRALESINYNMHISDITGRIDVSHIKAKSEQFQDCDYLLCGPSSMINSLKKQLNKIGISNSRIHSEIFNLN